VRIGRLTRWWPLGAVALMAGTLLCHLERPSHQDRAITALRDTLRVLRASVESCQAGLDRAAARLRADRLRLDSQHARVREMENIDDRGVPVDSYSTYLEAFDSYNDSVEGWKARADTLDLGWQNCRQLAEQHNALTDSLHRAMVRDLEERTKAPER